MRSGKVSRISREFSDFRKNEAVRLSRIFRGLNIPEVQIDRLIPEIMQDYKIDVAKEILKRRTRI